MPAMLSWRNYIPIHVLDCNVDINVLKIIYISISMEIFLEKLGKGYQGLLTYKR